MIAQKKLKKYAILSIDKINNSKFNKNYFTKPFKHLVIDNFFPISIANASLSNFPYPNSQSWIHANDSDIEIKQRSGWDSEFDIPDGIINAVRILNSSLFLKSISKRFNIDKILPDPYFTGGGLNQTQKNGLLDVHIDGNFHDATGLNRRLNAILFLNKNWKPSWKGELGLYDNKGQKCLKKIRPLFNRLFVFDTHDYSFHGLPEPLNFPKNQPRRSIILYYYTKSMREKKNTKVTKPHSALWIKRGIKDKKGNKTRNIIKN